MKKQIYGVLISWSILLIAVLSVFGLREYLGIYNIEEVTPVITSVKVNNKKIGISWDCSNTSVTSYNIYKKSAGRGYVYCATVPCRTAYYWDGDAGNNQVNTYMVRAVNSKSTSGMVSSQMSAPSLSVVLNQDKAIPKDLSEIVIALREVTKDDGIANIQWQPAENVPFSGYLIFRSTAGSEWEQIGQTTADRTWYQDQTREPGVEYEYSICAYADVGQERITSNLPFSIGEIGTVTPVITKVLVDKDKGIGIRWMCTNTMVTSYNIYKIESGKYVFHASVPADTRTFWDQDYNAGQINSYVVKAINSKAGTDQTVSQFSKPSMRVVMNPQEWIPEDWSDAAVVIQNAKRIDGAAELCWENLENIPFSGYLIYRRIQGQGWERIGDTSGERTYTDRSVEDGVEYEYAVCAYSDEEQELRLCTWKNAVPFSLGGTK